MDHVSRWLVSDLAKEDILLLAAYGVHPKHGCTRSCEGEHVLLLHLQGLSCLGPPSTSLILKPHSEPCPFPDRLTCPLQLQARCTTSSCPAPSPPHKRRCRGANPEALKTPDPHIPSPTSDDLKFVPTTDRQKPLNLEWNRLAEALQRHPAKQP